MVDYTGNNNQTQRSKQKKQSGLGTLLNVNSLESSIGLDKKRHPNGDNTVAGRGKDADIGILLLSSSSSQNDLQSQDE